MQFPHNSEFLKELFVPFRTPMHLLINCGYWKFLSCLQTAVPTGSSNRPGASARAFPECQTATYSLSSLHHRKEILWFRWWHLRSHSRKKPNAPEPVLLTLDQRFSELLSAWEWPGKFAAHPTCFLLFPEILIWQDWGTNPRDFAAMVSRRHWKMLLSMPQVS